MQDGQDGEHAAGQGDGRADLPGAWAGLSSGVPTSSMASTPAARRDAARRGFEQESRTITRLAAGPNWGKARAGRLAFP